MVSDQLRAALRDHGMVLLRDVFPREPLLRMRKAARGCFEAIEAGSPVPAHYRFSPHAHSVTLRALLDFGLETEEALTAPLSVNGLGDMFSELIGRPWRCALEHSWARKKFAPRNAPGVGYHLQDWHQDGALGAHFPPHPGPRLPIRNLATCWIPLQACGRESPGLQFIHQIPPGLLHFTELDDGVLRRRFPAETFWAPALEFGDGLVFRNDILHRTHADPDMREDRLSVEYRIFPREE